MHPPASLCPRFPRRLQLLPLHQASLPSLSCLDLLALQVSPDPPVPSTLTTKTSACMHGSPHRLCLGCIFVTEHFWGNPVWAEPPQVHGPNPGWALSAAAHLASTCSWRSPSSIFCLQSLLSSPSFQNDPFEGKTGLVNTCLKSFLCFSVVWALQRPSSQACCPLQPCTLCSSRAKSPVPSPVFPSAWSALSSSSPAHLSLHLADSYLSFKTIPPPQTSCMCYY